MAELDLTDVAAANPHKVADRWRPTSVDQIPFDSAYPANEQLPRSTRFVLRLIEVGGTTKSLLNWDGQAVGDPLTDASHIEDDYRMHGVFHLAHMAVLDWSPAMRSLLRHKRRSALGVDEAEDGGRAIAIEEGISALVFSYASRCDFLDGKTRVENELSTSSPPWSATWRLRPTAPPTGRRPSSPATRPEGDCGGVIDMRMASQTLTVSPPPTAGNA